MRSVFLFILFVGIPGFAEPTCSSLFETAREALLSEPSSKQFPSGHNVDLRQKMQEMQAYEQEMQAFSRLVRDEPNARTQENLLAAMQMVEKYQDLFNHIIEHASQKLMTPRIDRIDADKKTAYAQMYQQLYVNYAKFIERFASELQRLSQIPASEWTSKTLEEILREMASAQPEAHRRS